MQLVPENLTRFRDSYLLLELWRRSPFAATGATRDRLYGLCRLPLHPFFISFRDPVISESLLQAEVFALELMYILVYLNDWLCRRGFRCSYNISH